jgi:hypothetical protein
MRIFSAAGLTPARLGAVVRARATAWPQEPVEPLIAAMSAKARLISGRLLPAAHTDPSPEELVSHT